MDGANEAAAAIEARQNLGRYIGAFFDELMRCGVRDVVVSPGSRSTPLAMVAYEASVRFPKRFSLYVDVDERGAAFFALGLAKATGRAVCVVCTSGTAVGNYLPAVLEAETSRVPLLVLTGDRPARLQKLGAPQTCDQDKIYSDHVRKFVRMPEPGVSSAKIVHVRQVAREIAIAAAPGTHDSGPVHVNFPFDEPLVPDIAQVGLFEEGRQVGAESVRAECAADAAGKVNPANSMNATSTECPVGAANVAESPLARTLPAIVRGECYLPLGEVRPLADYLLAHTPIVLVGEGTFSQAAVCDPERRDREAQALFAFAETFDAPLLADPLSQLRAYGHPAIVREYDRIMSSPEQPAFDCVVRFGRYPVSKQAAQAVAASGAVQIVVDVRETRDFNSRTTAFVQADPLDFAVALLEAQAEVQAAPAGDNVARWAALDRERAERLETTRHPERSAEGADPSCHPERSAEGADPSCHPERSAEGAGPTCHPERRREAPESKDLAAGASLLQGDVSTALADARSAQHDESTYVRALLEEIPAGALLFSANSMSVRWLDEQYAFGGKRLTLLANRGLNGIDGTVSTAIGAAQANPDVQTVLLTGDLTMLHDLNALALQNEMLIRERAGHKRPSILVVLLNNNGGAIFDKLPQASTDPYFNRLFTTPQNVDFQAAARAFGVPTQSVAAVAEFREACRAALGQPGITLVEVAVQ